MIYRKGFCTLKYHNPTFEKKDDFFERFLLIDYRILFQKNVIFEDNFSDKIEVSGWMNTNMAAASYHPRILSSKYGQTGNVKPLTANHSLSFAVKWPNLDLKVSNEAGTRVRTTCDWENIILVLGSEGLW